MCLSCVLMGLVMILVMMQKWLVKYSMTEKYILPFPSNASQITAMALSININVNITKYIKNIQTLHHYNYIATRGHTFLTFLQNVPGHFDYGTVRRTRLLGQSWSPFYFSVPSVCFPLQIVWWNSLNRGWLYWYLHKTNLVLVVAFVSQSVTQSPFF